MRLKELKLQNFRNFSEKKFNFANKNLICGKNGTGKTNILEAIHLLSLGKSFRSKSNQDFLKHNTNNASISVQFSSQNSSRKFIQSLIIESQNHSKEIKKTFYKEGKKIPVFKIFGHFPMVFFGPEELKLVWGTPKDRRGILDLIIAQFKPIYVRQLWKLSRLLRQRNKLLFMIENSRASIKELEFWNQELTDIGSEIIFRRNSVILEINQYLSQRYQEISGTKDQLELRLFSSSRISEKEKNKKTIKKLFEQKIRNNLEIDLKNLSTGLGPHRDEPKLFLNKHNLESFGSRGEGRTAVLAFKFVQKQLLREKLNIQVISLFDDAFSELDNSRINYMLRNLDKEQVIFTATNIPKKLKNFNIIQL